MTNGKKATDEDIYGALSKEKIKEYEAEAKERWGRTDAYKQSQERVKKFTKDDWKRIREETDANLRALVALMAAGKGPGSPEVQAEIARHYAGIGRFFDCPTQVYRGLGDMYLADRRFGDFYRKYHADLPEFLVKGIHAFCDAREGRS